MKTVLLASAAVLLVGPACAADWTVNPWTGDFDNYSVTVGGEAHGTVFSPDLPKVPGFDQHWASGLADLKIGIQRDYDSGMSVALKSSFELAHDHLSSDNYGGRFVQKVYGLVQTGLGRVEIGMTDGAAYALSVTGPVVDDATTLDNANATFYLDPTTGRAFTDAFALNSAVESSLNYAKISYYTPRLFGIQLALSYTPSEGREVIPFLNNGPDVPNRQKSIWEAAASYSSTFGRTSVGFYAGAALGHGERKTPGHAGLTEYGFGTEIDYDLNDDMRLAFGGAWRHTNTYAFNIYDARTTGGTESAHLSSTLTWGPWIFGGEYGRGTAGGDGFSPTIGVRGWQGSVGYVFNANWQVTAGWQDLRYSRNAGAFYNGAPAIGMNAAFLHLKLHV
jgi:hypothetical protein